MIVYLTALFLSCGFALMAGRDARHRLSWMVASVLPLAMVAALRWGVGTDVDFLYFPQFRAAEWAYGGGGDELAKQLFQPLFEGGVRRSMAGTPVSAAAVFWHNFNVEECGYRWLVRGLIACGGSFRSFLVVTSLLTAALVFTAIWRQSRSPTLAILFYVLTSNYFLSLNVVRQYLAVGFVLLSVPLAVDRRYVRFALCVLIGALFHKSALIVLPVAALPFLQIRPWWGFAAVGLALGCSCFARPLLRIVLPCVGCGIYVKYLDSSFAREGFEILLFAINFCFMVVGAWYYRRATAQNRLFGTWYWMTVMGSMALAMSGTLPLMKRLNYYFAAPQFLLLPEALMAEERPVLRRVLQVGAVLAFAAETALAVMVMNKNEPLPYRIMP